MPPQSSVTQPPLKPTHTLRAHATAIHTLYFSNSNLWLLSGDAEGWVVVWDLVVRRAVLVWRAHTEGLLGVGVWPPLGQGIGEDQVEEEGAREGSRVITHGRDNKLKVWQLPASSSINPGAEWSQQGFSTVPPIEDAVTERKPPWLLHSLTVNALNFCSFAMISPPSQYPPAAADQAQHNANGISFDHETLIVATPGLEDGQIILTSLPSETRLSTVLPPAEAKPKTGMVMAIALHYPPSPPSTTTAASTPSTAAPLPSIYAGYESGHTAIFIPTPNSNPSSPQDPLKTTKWQTTYLSQPHTQPLLSLCLSPKKKIWYSSSADAVIARHPLYPCPATTSTAAPKVFGTKHAGQQSLTVRGGDEKVMASAGWDGRVRVYAVSAGSSSNKSREEGLRELACLKWHAAGVGSVAFGEVAGSKKGEGGAAGVDGEEEKGKRVLTTSEGGRRLTVAEQRVKKTRETHWLAAGGKDGRISLWDIY